MKSFRCFLLAAMLAGGGTGSAQTGSPPAKEVKAIVQDSSVVPDGIVFYRGHTYLVRNERAALANVPEGMVLTATGRRVPLPTDFVVYISPPRCGRGCLPFAIRRI